MLRPVCTLCMSILLLAATARSSHAAMVVQGLDFEYSGGTPPAGAAPWVRATFDDGGGSGSVTMKLDALNLTGSEFVSKWLFNLDPALDPALLNFSVQSSTGAFATPSALTGIDAFGAAGNTKFDILVDFAVAPPADRFTAGDSITFQITGIPTLTAHSFSFLSIPGGKGPYISAAHIQGIGPGGGDSGWIAVVPEPGAAAIFLGVLVLARRARRP